jgi:hypothetical protein
MAEKEPLLRDLLARHPRDPRTRLYSGLLAEENDEGPEAEEHLEKGLAEREILTRFFPDGLLEQSMRTALARILLARGADAEARDAFRPACAGLRGEAPKTLSPDWAASVCGSAP